MSRGVVVGRTTAQGAFQSRFLVVQADPSIRWLDKIGQPHQFQLQFSLPYPYHDHHVCHTLFDSRKSDKFALIVLPRYGMPADTPVCVRLFLWRENKNGQLCTYRAAQLYLPVSDLLAATQRVTKKQAALDRLDVKLDTIAPPLPKEGIASGQELVRAMTNVMGDPQATLILTQVKVASAEPAEFKLAPPTGRWALSFANTLSEQEMTGGHPASGPVADLFRRSHISFFDGQRMPVDIFCQLHDRPDIVEPVPDAYLNNAIEHAVRWVGFDSVEAWIKSLFSDRGLEVLAQVLGFYAWACPYLFDETYNHATGRFKMFDQFSALKACPCVAAWAGDCEDFSHDIQLMFNAILRRRLADPQSLSPGLRALVQIAQGYCSFVFDASIYNGKARLTTNPCADDPNAVNLHMYVQLIPWGKVDKLLRNGGYTQIADQLNRKQVAATAGWPILSHESTEINLANWNIRTPHIDQFVARMSSTLHSESDRKLWSRLKIHASGEFLMNDQFYRQDLAAYSVDLYTRFGIRTLIPLRRAVGTKVWCRGVPKLELMNMDTQKESELAFCIPHVANAAHKQLVQDVQNRIPLLTPLRFTGDSKTVYEKGDDVIRIFTRQWEWTQDDARAFHQCIARAGTHIVVGEPQAIRMMDELTLWMYQIKPAPRTALTVASAQSS